MFWMFLFGREFDLYIAQVFTSSHCAGLWRQHNAASVQCTGGRTHHFTNNTDGKSQQCKSLRIQSCDGGCTELCWRLCRAVMATVQSCDDGCAELWWLLCRVVMAAVRSCDGDCVELWWRLCRTVMATVHSHHSCAELWWLWRTVITAV